MRNVKMIFSERFFTFTLCSLCLTFLLACGVNKLGNGNVEQSSTRGGELENDTDRPGADYRSLDLPQARPEICQAECGSDPKCKAFVYVKPGVQGPGARCWLKSAAPPAARNSCCISGVIPRS